VLHDVEPSGRSPARTNGDLPLTIEDLPPRFNRRWTSPLKNQLLEAIDGGLLSINDAAARYALQSEVIHGWRAGPTSPPEPALAASPQASEARLTRLVSVLLMRGLIDQEDADYIVPAPEQAGLSLLDALMVSDNPVF